MFEEIEEEKVREMLKKVKARKATGNDGVCGRILKTCSEQFAIVFGKLFN